MQPTSNKMNFRILAVGVLFFCLSFLFWGDFDFSVILLVGSCVAMLCALILIFNLNWFYLLLVGFIPISINIPILYGAKLSMPSEVLAFILMGYLILFVAEYRRGITGLIRHPISIALLVLFGVEVLTSFTSTHFDVSTKRILIRFVFIVVFYFSIVLFNSAKLKSRILFAYSLGLLPVMLLVLLAHSRYDFDPRVVFSICQPYFTDHTIYGACLAFIIPFMIVSIQNKSQFEWNRKYFYLWSLLLIIVLVAVFLALSRAALLSLIIAFVFYILLYFRVKFKSILIGLGICLSIGFYFRNSILDVIQANDAVSNDGNISNHFSSVTNLNSDASNLERINRWVCALRMFEQRPLIGYGPGTYQFEYNAFQSSDTRTYISTNSGDRGNAHSEYLSYLSETGIGGLFAFILLLFTSVYYGMKNHYSLEKGVFRSLNLAALLGLITFYFHSLFNSFFDQSEMSVLVYVSLGIIASINLGFNRTRIDFLEDEEAS